MDLAFPRRNPRSIALKLLDCIDENDGKASKWALIKILGNTAQFHYWVDDFLLKEHFLTEISASQHQFYAKTELGDLLHRLLKHGRIMDAFLKLSGKRLRRF